MIMIKNRCKYDVLKFLVFRFVVCHTNTTTEITLNYQSVCEKWAQKELSPTC